MIVVPPALRPPLDALRGLAILTAFWGLGAVVAWGLPLPVTGSMWGMVLLFVALRAGVLPERWVARASRILIASLGLLFVPVGVGIVAYERLVLDNGLAIAVSLGVGSLLTVLAAAGAARAAWRR